MEMNMATLDPSLIIRPRSKKVLLSQPCKKRRTAHTIEVIEFDASAREDYLTGFHKRKLQRIKNAQLEAAKKQREERIALRKQLREDRKKDLEDHVKSVKRLVEEADGQVVDEESNEWIRIKDDGVILPPLVSLDHQEEYMDEDRYTTVTVEDVDISKEGLRKVVDEENIRYEAEFVAPNLEKNKGSTETTLWPKKPKKKKFRYETKAERKANRAKEKAGRRSKADTRKGYE